MSRSAYPMRSYDPSWITVKGSFQPNGTSAPTVSATPSRGWTVVRTSTGLFTITFTDPFTAHRDSRASLRLATGDDKFAQAGVVSTSALTMQVRIWDISAAAVADVALDPDNVLSFAIDVSQSKVR